MQLSRFLSSEYDMVRHFCYGIFMVLGLMSLFMLSSQEDENAKPAFHLFAQFENITGIAENSAIYLVGVKIGEVGKINLMHPNNAIQLRLDFYAPLNIPYDSGIKIVSDGLFGSKYLKIIPGAEIDYLRIGENFEYVQNAVQLEKILAKIIKRAEHNLSIK